MYFAKHETFHIRDGWLYKGLNAIEDDPNVFLLDNAPEHLGLGKNMVRALRYWMQATGLSEESWANRTKEQYPTKFGMLVKEYDPYLERDETIWLIHYNLISNIELTTSWYWFFNSYQPVSFTHSEFIERLSHWIITQSSDKDKKISENSLRKDFDCLVRTYMPNRYDRSPEDLLESPLSSLSLFSASKERDEETGKQYQRYRYESARLETIHPLVFLHVLILRQEVERPNASQVNLTDALREPMNVGKTFNIGMIGFEDLIQKLDDGYDGLQVQFVRTGSLDQLSLPDVSSAEILESLYKEQL